MDAPVAPRRAGPVTAAGGTGRGPGPRAAPGPGDRSRRLADVLAPLLIAGVAAVAHRGVLDLWWLFDDFTHIEVVLRHAPWQYWADRVAQAAPQDLVTPWLMASLDLDITRFGVSARAAYLHHLGSFLLLVPATYGLARQFAGPLPAALVTGLVAFGVPTATAVSLVMARHYLEGLLFAELAALGWVLAVRRRSGGLALASAAGYGLAVSAKEVFVPLPLLLLVLDEGEWRDRRRALAGQLVVLAAYLPWRYWMLGTLGGGYGFAVLPEERLAAWAGIPWALARASAGEAWPAGGALLLVMGGVAAAGVLRSARGAAALAVAAALALGPVAPVANAVDPRYALVPWVLLALGMLPALGRWGPRPTAAVAVTCALLLGLTAIPSWRARMATLGRMSAEGRLVSRMAPGEALREPISVPNALHALRAHHRVLFGRDATADWFYDDLYLCGHRPRRVWTWSESRRAFAEADPALLRRAAALCADVPVTAPLEASFRWRGDALAWRLGPHPDGEYAFILDEGRRLFVMPRTGGFRLPGVEEIELRIRYRGGGGTVVYSRPIRIRRADGPALDYRQP